MTDIMTPTEVEDLAKKTGLPMAEVCRRAGVAQSTFTRWKSGKTQPSIDVYRRLCAAARPVQAAEAI